MNVARQVVRRLLSKPRNTKQLYAVLRYCHENDVDIALTTLLRAGIIGVSSKRFYIRDMTRAMKIANGDHELC